MFGVRQEDIQSIASMSLPEAIETLLTIPEIEFPVKDYTTDGAAQPDTHIAPGAPWYADYSPDDTIRGRRTASFKRWLMRSAMEQRVSIGEKLTFFWTNHFSTDTQNGQSHYILDYYRILREHALGNFLQLVKLVTLHPQMLYYLNGNQNTKWNPDENYARELQELFTLGNDNDPNFMEDDVKAAARILTGWYFEWQDFKPVLFNAGAHDTESKQFSAFYNNTIIEGREGAEGAEEEIDALLKMIFSKKEAVSRYIVKELYRFFCSSNITADVESSIIIPLADSFQSANWEIRPVLEELFLSEHFFSLMGEQVKSPIDFVAGLYKDFEVALPEDPQIAASFMDSIVYRNVEMGLNLADPPNVAGYPAYYQSPLFDKLWINSATLPLRTNHISNIIYGWSQKGHTLKADLIAFAHRTSNPSDPYQLISDSIDFLFQVPVSEALKQTLKKEILLNNLDNENYWTASWNAYQSNPTDENFKIVNSRLVALYIYLLGMGEYELV